MVKKQISVSFLGCFKKRHTFALQKQSNGSTIFASTLSEAMIIKRDHYVEASVNVLPEPLRTMPPLRLFP